MIPTFARAAAKHLSEADPVMEELCFRFGLCDVFDKATDPFDSLVRSIIGQQLSAKAAATIRRRVGILVGEPFSVDRFVNEDRVRLRDAGLSKAKMECIYALCRHVADDIVNFDSLNLESDDVVRATLLQVRGIGPWTCEMFLIFGLNRPDVISLNDAGLRKAFALALWRSGFNRERHGFYL